MESMTLGEALAEQVKRLREKDGLTQKRIALRAGLPVKTIELIESGNADDLRHIEFFQLAEYFGLYRFSRGPTKTTELS